MAGMKIACDVRCFAPLGWETALREIHSAGLRQVELPLAVLADESGVIADEAVDCCRQLLGELGLTVAAVPLSDFDLPRRLSIARQLRAPLVVVDAGRADSEAERAAAIDRLRQLADEAAERELVLALDTRPGLCGDAREMLRMLRELSRPAGLYFDTGAYVALNPGSSGEVALQRVCTKLLGVRLRDATGTPGDENHPPLGQGAAVDFARTRDIVQALRFGGPCSISFTPHRSRKPPTIEQCRAGLQRCLLQLRRGGWFEESNP